MEWSEEKKWLEWGRTAGIIYLLLFVPDLVLSVLSAVTSSFFISMMVLIADITLGVTSCLLLYATAVFGKKMNLRSLEVRSQVAAALNIFVVIWNSILLPISQNTPYETWVFIGGLFFLIALVVSLLLIGKSIKSLIPEYGEYAQSASKWLVLTGWFCASVILSPLVVVTDTLATWALVALLGEALRRGERVAELPQIT